MNMQRMDAFQCAQLQKILENPESNTIWYDSLEEALKKGCYGKNFAQRIERIVFESDLSHISSAFEIWDNINQQELSLTEVESLPLWIDLLHTRSYRPRVRTILLWMIARNAASREDFTFFEQVARQLACIGEAVSNAALMLKLEQGMYCYQFAQLDAAINCYQAGEKIAFACIAQGFSDVSLSMLYSNWAVVYTSQQKYGDAVNCYRKAIDMERKKQQPDRFEMAKNYCNIGAVLRRAGDISGAIVNYSQAKRLWDDYMGVAHVHACKIHKIIKELEASANSENL